MLDTIHVPQINCSMQSQICALRSTLNTYIRYMFCSMSCRCLWFHILVKSIEDCNTSVALQELLQVSAVTCYSLHVMTHEERKRWTEIATVLHLGHKGPFLPSSQETLPYLCILSCKCSSSNLLPALFEDWFNIRNGNLWKNSNPLRQTLKWEYGQSEGETKGMKPL